MSDVPHMHSPLPPGARCAIHPERAAERTCVRCGNYMCSECGAGEQPGICLTCASRVGPAGGTFPYSRDHYTLDGLLNLALSRWKAHWKLLLATFGSAIIVIYGLSFAFEGLFSALATRQGLDSAWLSPLHPVRLSVTVFLTIVQVAVQLMLMGLCLDLLRGERPNLPASLQRLRKLPAVFLQVLVVYAAIAVDLALHYGLYLALGGWEAGWTPLWIVLVTWLIGVPPRIYVFLGVLYSQLVLLVEPHANAFSAFVVSWRTVSGHRFEVLGIGLVTVLIMAVGVIACCVGVLVSLPVATMLYCALFLALSNQQTPPAALRHEHWDV
jgi:hypothetical protein